MNPFRDPKTSAMNATMSRNERNISNTSNIREHVNFDEQEVNQLSDIAKKIKSIASTIAS